MLAAISVEHSAKNLNTVREPTLYRSAKALNALWHDCTGDIGLLKLKAASLRSKNSRFRFLLVIWNAAWSVTKAEAKVHSKLVTISDCHFWIASLSRLGPATAFEISTGALLNRIAKNHKSFWVRLISQRSLKAPQSVMSANLDASPKFLILSCHQLADHLPQLNWLENIFTYITTPSQLWHADSSTGRNQDFYLNCTCHDSNATPHPLSQEFSRHACVLSACNTGIRIADYHRELYPVYERLNMPCTVH